MTGDHSDLPEILSHVDPATCDYSTWVSVGMALKAAGLAVDVWDNWSRLDPERYHVGECESKWDTFGDGGEGMVGPGSIVALAKMRGWEPEAPDGGVALDWGDRVEVATLSPEGLPAIDDACDGSPWNGVEDLLDYLTAVFRQEDVVGYVMASDGEGRPRGRGVYSRTAGELEAALEREMSEAEPSVAAVLGDWSPENGAWIRVNPLDGEGIGNANVAEFRHVLVESDTMDPAAQLKFLNESRLPIAAVTSSAGKSVHALVRVNAPTKREYDRRVDYLFKWLKARGFDVDSQNRNPSRLSRIPGVTRGNRRQRLLARNMGSGTWEAWEEWAIAEDDGLPEIQTLASVWDDMPPLAEPLIDGVLRLGHKMLLAGPSKAGKSFALINLAISVAEGVDWLGWPCKRGRVLYVNLELDEASCDHRFKDSYRARDLEPRHTTAIEIWNLRGRSSTMDVLAPRLINRAANHNLSLVIIDPIYKVITGDENNASDMARFCNAFDRIAAELGCAVAYCHHHSKGLQGQKRSMDRASGSGVFARDPDALLDMSPLDVSDREKGAHVQSALREISLDMASRRAPLLDPAQLRKMATADLVDCVRANLGGDDAEELDRRVASARLATPWRIEGTLREFPSFDPKDVWFQFPLHVVDGGSLKGAEVAGDYAGTGRGRRTEAAGKARERKTARKRAEKGAAIEAGVSACEADGVSPTVANVLERMPEVDGKAVSRGQLKHWTSTESDWSPYVSDGGLLVKRTTTETETTDGTEG